MSKLLSKVLYVGNNVTLARSLLAINDVIKADDFVHISGLKDIEIVLKKDEFTHFISELPLSNLLKKYISDTFPQLQCTYLNEANVEATKESTIPVAINTVLDDISIPIYYQSLTGEIIACNHAFSSMLALPSHQIIGHQAETILNTAIIGEIKRSTLTTDSELPINFFECELLDAEGVTRELIIRKEQLKNSNALVAMLLDVSEINTIKRTIEKEKMMLRATTNLSKDLIFFKDLNSRFLGCNKQFESFVGHPERDIIGKKDKQLFSHEQAVMCETQDTQVMATGEVYAGDEYLTYQNGRKHFISMQKVPLKDKHGQVQGLIGIGRDITEKSIIKKQLKVANVVFENSRDAILVTDDVGTIITLNDACYKMSGYAESELLNKRINEFSHETNKSQLFWCIERALKREGEWQGHTDFNTKSGDLSYFWLEIYVVKHRETGVENRVYSFTDLTRNKYNEEKIQYLSKHDALTGLNNRIALVNYLETAISRANAKQASMGIIFIEVKAMIGLNERLGHNQSDVVLKEVATRLNQSIQHKDMIARFADDQFILVFEELENEQMLALVAQKVAKELACPVFMDHLQVNLYSAIGISICPDDGASLDSMLASAELAMLRSKEDKSSAYHFYTNELTIHSVRQTEREDELKAALEGEQFEIYYQPQYDLSSRKIIAMSSVMRWHHPSQGLLLPDQFLMLAEQSGVLNELALSMLTQVAKQAVKWSNAGVYFGRIAFTLSEIELSQVSLIATLQKVLLDTGCQTCWLEFEIAERVFSSELDTVQDNLFNISRLGIPLTVDGVGAERSVLYSMGRLSIDKFKISSDFTQGLPNDIAGEAMIKSVFVLANSLGVDVVGERIENAQQPTMRSAESGMLRSEYFQKQPMKASEATFYLRCHKRK